MDIYSFINSPDIADHCRKIGHVFNALEMAVIIAYSEKTIKEKHAAWREIIADHPDMPIPESNCFDAQRSLHDYLRQVIALDEKWLTEFYAPETGAVYRVIVCQYGKEKLEDGCYSTAEQAWTALYDEWKDEEHADWDWKADGIESVYLIKEQVDVNECPRKLQVNANSDALAYIGHKDGYPDSLDDIFIDLPLPFERGDIITCWDKVFVLDNVPHWNSGRGKKYEEYLTGPFNDRTDMMGWGLFVSDSGVLYGDHTGVYDYYRYYRGKLKGVNRLLHYVSLFMKGEEYFRLPELLTMQGRIMLEHLIENGLLIKSHGCYVSDDLLAENRLTPEEKEEIQKTNGLMPWLAGKLSIHQVEFLIREFGGDSESVQKELSNGGSWYMGMCAKIVHDENYYAKTNDARFNPARRDMAKMFLEVYGHTENDWIDSHADGNSDDGGIPIPDYSKLKNE